MIRDFHIRDLGDVTRMDGDWSLESYAWYLDYDGYTGRVLTECGRIVGAAMYRFDRHTLHLHRVVVPEFVRRRGYGRQVVDHLKDMLRPERQTRIVAEVSEYDLAAQLFLKSCGFRWTGSMQSFYRMEFAITPADSAWLPLNRVGRLIGSV